MNVVGRFVDILRDSPTYGRDRANLISGFTIGTTALLLNGAVLMLVLPLMLDPDDRDFRELTEHVEFGQLLALILLGGATGFATVLIPLRLVSVFWGPRIGRYFDQIVLSGISPLRYVIGKAISQNLFLGLILLLLLPYLILSLTLGGVNLEFFLAGLFLVWLYCMALALVTLWLTLYMNELLAAVVVIFAATILSVLGCLPMSIQPFVMTPFPVLSHSLYSSIPYYEGRIPTSFFPLFASCTACMASMIGISLLAIYLGPLYGIIRENSTFGEVIRAGDSKRKRWFRLRLHIQRPSEIAFFYENRSDMFQRNEGLIRWGLGFCGLVLLSCAAQLVFVYLISTQLNARIGQTNQWWVNEFHVINLLIHSFSILLAVFLYSHAKNSTYLLLPFTRGRTAEVARLDTIAFLLFTLVSTALSIATPYLFEQYLALPKGLSVFPEITNTAWGLPIDYLRVAVEGSVVISVAGLVVYAFHRFLCLMTWTKSVSFLLSSLYLLGICLLPLFISVLFMEIPELRRIQFLADSAPRMMMISPIPVITYLFNGLGPRFPPEISTAPFYIVQSILLGLAIMGIRRRGRKLRKEYLAEPEEERK